MCLLVHVFGCCSCGRLCDVVWYVVCVVLCLCVLFVCVVCRCDPYVVYCAVLYGVVIVCCVCVLCLCVLLNMVVCLVRVFLCDVV